MIYLVISIISGILLLIAYYGKRDSVERKYSVDFEKYSDTRNTKVKTIWQIRKTTDNKELKKQLTYILLLRYISFAAVLIPFILYLFSNKE
ncbi:MAG TPA: hypothetical protein VK212_01695 [Lentimicrobium sp.]|nr:hypothetical protein [Lentimicrobium sp.]